MQSKPRALLNIQTTATASTPMQPASSSVRPKPSRPHGFKSAISNMFQPSSDPDFEVVALQQTTGPLSLDAKTVDAGAGMGSRDFSAEGASKCFYYPEDYYDDVTDTPIETGTPVLTMAPETLSRSYRKLLSKRYSYSSLYSGDPTLKRTYTRPDLDAFSYSQPSHRLPSGTTDSEIHSYDYLTRTDVTTTDPDFTQTEFDNDDFETSSRTSQESTHTIHNMSMLPIVAPERTTIPLVDQRRPSASGHSQLLETYAGIMGEIGDLVPEHALSPQALSAQMSRRKMSASALHMEDLLLLQAMSSPTSEGDKTPRRRITPQPSTYSLLGAYDDSNADTESYRNDSISSSAPTELSASHDIEFVIEEYYVKHWVPSVLEGEVSSDSGSSNGQSPITPADPQALIAPSAEQDEASKFSISVYETAPEPESTASPPSILSETSNSSVELVGDATPASVFEPDAEEGLEIDEDHHHRSRGEQLIVSKVTRVITLNRMRVIQNVELKVEPIAKVESVLVTPTLAAKPGPSAYNLNTRSSLATLASVSEMKSPVSAVSSSASTVVVAHTPPTPVVMTDGKSRGKQQKLKEDDGHAKSGKDVKKRRSGLSNFLQFLASS
ncbi:hypothetical protein BJ741DRAFT_629680 [Chytriomyces cf. hyalinus JEL632]|nr:hypothetical protein BJ741DRAFT_629680 [Chytriomyces cf. hyalinus JEL632]